MKISKKLPQFKDNACLFLISGREDAKFYVARDGEITRAASFRVKKLDYSDHEGFREKKMSGESGLKHGKVQTAGSEYEMKDPTLIHDFLTRVSEEFKKIMSQNSISKIFLFCPPYMKAPIKKSLPGAHRKKISLIVHGDFHATHPFEFIKMVQKLLEAKRIKLIKPEARKILQRRQV